MAQSRPPGDETWQTRPRRRAVEAALKRRPDIAVDDLLSVLERLGFDVTEEVLRGDLDSLGFEIDPGDEEPVPATSVAAGAPSPASTGRPARRGVRPPASPAPPRLLSVPEADLTTPTEASAVATVVEVDAFADRPVVVRSAGADEGEAAPSRRRGAVAVLVAVVALIVAAALLLPPDDAEDTRAGERSDEGADRSGRRDDGDATTVAPTTESDVPPDRRDPELADEAELNLDLTFDTDSPDLPPVDDLGPWEGAGGDWFQRGGTAQVAMTAEPRAVAYLAAPGPDLRAEVTLPEGTSGAGIAFRVQGNDTYLAWVIAPRFYTANLYRVSGGRARLVKNAGVVAVQPGVRVGVHVVDRLVELLVDGRTVATFDDVWSSDATGIGMVAVEPSESPVFDDLRVRFEG